MAFNVARKLGDNIAAIRIALDSEQGKRPNAAGMAALQQYAGFGGIKAILFPAASKEEWIQLNASEADLRLYDDVMSLHDLLRSRLPEAEYKAVVDSLKHSVLSAFYTPAFVPQTIYAALKGAGIKPQRLYEPSAGAGVFITEAVEQFPNLQYISAVEKDLLTGKVLQAIASGLPIANRVHITGLEQTSNSDNGSYDVVISNIPFGNFQVYDPACSDKSITGRIHNYFFAKGLDKVANGGILAYITTDAFLNNASNEAARTYLFERADFVSLTVMPDNLMKDTGNTEAPNHLLIVQKRNDKVFLNETEQQLLKVLEESNEHGSYAINSYIAAHPEIIAANEITADTNQYGQAHRRIWQTGAIETSGELLRTILTEGLASNFDKEAFSNAQLSIGLEHAGSDKQLTLLPVPEGKAEASQVQLGLFDTAIAESANRATAYLTDRDKQQINQQTARIMSTIRPTSQPQHETIILMAAQANGNNRYVYKLCSNAQEIKCPPVWLSGEALHFALQQLSSELRQYAYDFIYEGDKTLESAFALERKAAVTISDLKPFYKEGMLLAEAGIIGRLTKNDPDSNTGLFEPQPSLQNRFGYYQQYCRLRDSYLELTTIEANESSRERLQDQYENFVSQYGLLNHISNKRLLSEDLAFGFTILSSLERRDGERFVAADVLTQSLAPVETHFQTDDPLEALARSLNDTGRVDISFIEAATGLSDEEVIKGLRHHIYLNPSTRHWETADQWLSGNVVEKRKTAIRSCDKFPDDVQLKESLEAIEKVQPERIPFELLDFNLGERWMPTDYYDRFASELFEVSASVHYFPSSDSFKVAASSWNAKITQEYAVTPKSGKTTYGYSILEHALENTAPFYTYEVQAGNSTIRVPDNEAIQLAHQKIESIRTRFVEWLQALPQEDKASIEQLYNDTFNCYVLREYDGSHLQFPGLDKQALGIDDLYDSQKNAAWRIIQNRGALIDHEVGLGKTLTMIIAAQEMKRLGIVHKPMILALKANVDQIRATYRKAYPKSKVLAPTENDFTPDKRLRLFHEIKNNNWDCIILTHDQFGKIMQSQEVQREIFQTELDNTSRDLDTVKQLGGEISRSMLKGLQIRQNNLVAKLKAVEAAIEEKKDDGIDFNDMGVDHLFVDESHMFKNLTFTTRHNRVAGLGNMEGSQKALNMLFAVRTLQRRFDADLCVTFLSGTPISNSLTEMYLLFKYLRPKEMERQRIENFDGWAAVFARKTTDFEFSVTNEIIAKERFRHFIKVPELALFYNEITDYKTAKHINLDRPELDEMLVNIKPTPDQEYFTKQLMAFAKTGNAKLIGRAPLTPSEDKGRMLIATNYAKKMAADMRLISESYDDHPDNKVNVCARKIAELYHETYEHRGTQLVFCDIGTPKEDAFNMYDALKEKLVRDFNIPAYEITFIHDWPDKKKPELFRKVNNGQIRITLGSTAKLGTGTNVQERVIAMHHLDVPWKPSELEQRNGRAARQGNKLAKSHYNNKVRNFIYAKEQSLDTYKFNLLKNKQTFISQMKNCELNVRTIDEGAIDENSGMNFSEYIAVLSGDTSLLEKSKLEKKVAVMESLKKAHFKEASQARWRLEHMESERSNAVQLVAQLTQDESSYKENLQFTADGTKQNPILLKGLDSADAEQIGRHIIDTYKHWKPRNEPVIGSLYGFDLCIRQHSEWISDNGKTCEHTFNTLYAESPVTHIKYTFSQGHPNVDNPKLAARHFLNAIDRVSSLKEKYQQSINELDKEIPIVSDIVHKPFEKEAELMEMKTRLSALEREISLKIQEAQLKQRQGEQQQDTVDEEKEATVIELHGSIDASDEEQVEETTVVRRRGMRM